MPPFAVELVAKEGLRLVVGHAEVLDVSRCQLLGAEVPEIAKVRRGLSEGAFRFFIGTFRRVGTTVNKLIPRNVPTYPTEMQTIGRKTYPRTLESYKS